MTAHSRRRQLVLGSTALVAVLILLLVGVLGVALRQQQFAGMDEALLGELTEFQEVAERGPNELRKELALERAAFHLIALHRDEGDAGFYWGCTALDAAGFPRPPAGPPAVVGNVRPAGSQADVRVAAVRLGEHTAYLGLSHATADAAFGRYLRVAAVAVVAVFVALLIGLRALAARVFDPIERITATARRISADRLEERVPVGASGDELDRLASLLNEMLERLAGSFAALSQFTGNVSHELRTPLTTIRLTLENVLGEETEPAEVRAAIEQSLEELGRLERLVGTLLRLARSDGGGGEGDFVRTDLSEICRRTVESLAPVAEAGRIEIHLEGCEAAPVLGDPDQLRDLLLALLENALRFTPGGGRITIGCRRTDGRIRLLVSDVGPGIPPGDAERLFLPFERGTEPAPGGHEGFGLGLAIARGIARRHGGTLHHEPAPAGTGACFVLEIPVTE